MFNRSSQELFEFLFVLERLLECRNVAVFTLALHAATKSSLNLFMYGLNHCSSLKTVHENIDF